MIMSLIMEISSHLPTTFDWKIFSSIKNSRIIWHRVDAQKMNEINIRFVHLLKKCSNPNLYRNYIFFQRRNELIKKYQSELVAPENPMSPEDFLKAVANNNPDLTDYLLEFDEIPDDEISSSEDELDISIGSTLTATPISQQSSATDTDSIAEEPTQSGAFSESPIEQHISVEPPTLTSMDMDISFEQLQANQSSFGTPNEEDIAAQLQANQSLFGTPNNEDLLVHSQIDQISSEYSEETDPIAETYSSTSADSHVVDALKKQFNLREFRIVPPSQRPKVNDNQRALFFLDDLPDTDKSSCKICTEEKIDLVFLPCGHCSCSSCFSQTLMKNMRVI